MKRIFFIVFCIGIAITKSIAQGNKEAVLTGYENLEYKYFDSVNRLDLKALECLNHSYMLYLTFKVTKDGTVTDVRFFEIPGIQIPQSVKQHIDRLLKSTNGRWQPQVRNSENVLSDEMVYQVNLKKNHESIEEDARDTDAILKYFFGRDIPLDPDIERLAVAKNKKYMILSF
jgi:hypothetical protein